jgi:hypothetical protein
MATLQEMHLSSCHQDGGSERKASTRGDASDDYRGHPVGCHPARATKSVTFR